MTYAFPLYTVAAAVAKPSLSFQNTVAGVRAVFLEDRKGSQRDTRQFRRLRPVRVSGQEDVPEATEGAS